MELEPLLAPTEPVEPACEASGVEEGEVLEVPGVELVEDCDCEDCEPHFEAEALSGEVLDGVDDALEEEVLDCGLLLADESGVEVLPAAPVVLLVLELLAMLPVCELAEASGVLDALDCALMSLGELLGEAALALLGLALLGLVEELFGEEVVLFGVEVLGVLEVLELLEVDEPALPEMLPAVFWSELDGVAAAEPPVAAAVAMVRSLSLTFLTPETDLASFLASFLSSLLATEPLRFAVPLLTEICTP
jgi:hypothetical protein